MKVTESYDVCRLKVMGILCHFQQYLCYNRMGITFSVKRQTPFFHYRLRHMNLDFLLFVRQTRFFDLPLKENSIFTIFFSNIYRKSLNKNCHTIPSFSYCGDTWRIITLALSQVFDTLYHVQKNRVHVTISGNPFAKVVTAVVPSSPSWMLNYFMGIWYGS